MIEMAEKHLRSVVAAGKLVGSKLDCEYYPCHFHAQDCTWCFCPFYPCGDLQTGGEWIVDIYTKIKVWDCSGCNWIHRPEIAGEILKEILKLIGESKFNNFNEAPREKLLKIRLKVKLRRTLQQR